MQVVIGSIFLSIGMFFTALVIATCCCLFKFARSFARRGDGNAPARPNNAVSGALYDVSAKYGKWIPGGAAYPGAQVGHVPVGSVQEPPKGSEADPWRANGGGGASQPQSPMVGTQPHHGAAYGYGAPAFGDQAQPQYGAGPAYAGPAPPSYGASESAPFGMQPQPHYSVTPDYGAPGPSAYGASGPPVPGMQAPQQYGAAPAYGAPAYGGPPPQPYGGVQPGYGGAPLNPGYGTGLDGHGQYGPSMYGPTSLQGNAPPSGYPGAAM